MTGHSTNHHSPTALAYARSLLELANEQGQAEAVAGELDAVREVLDAVPVFGAFLADPGISTGEREGVLKRTFEGKLSPLVMSFLGVINLKGRTRILPDILSAYDSLLGDQLGKIEVDVIVAERLAPDELENVRLRISGALKKDAVVYQYVDAAIIGGLIIRVGDQLIDASVRSQLNAIRRRMLTARIPVSGEEPPTAVT